ncbi:MAG: transglutaminase-like domain-containing protein [Oscillospiraceae bacterium]|nr:transglutaminase-like domain-containing protein [Oscillospiraceae bacterium]
MKKSVVFLAVICALALGLCGCNTAAALEQSNVPPLQSNAEPEKRDPADDLPTVREYIRQVVKEHVSGIEKPGMTEYEKVKAVFDYVLELGYFADPPALDVWRWRTAADEIPSREEMRGLNMLLFGAETCEGYAAAFNMLLAEMGVETRYLTGLTYLAQGGLGYHSWSQVKIDGVWYHIDPDLEDGISKNGTVIYRYFLKSDESMKRSHYWGQRLINMDRLADEQEAEIAANYMGESCPKDYPTPSKDYIPVTKDPDVTAIRTNLRAELAAYEELYGELEYMDLGAEPPVFINYFLDKRGQSGVDQDMVTFAEIYQPTHCVIRKAGTENADLSMIPEEKQYGFILY